MPFLACPAQSSTFPPASPYDARLLQSERTHCLGMLLSTLSAGATYLSPLTLGRSCSSLVALFRIGIVSPELSFSLTLLK